MQHRSSSSIARWFGKLFTPAPRSTVRRVRLAFDVLEDRTVPSPVTVTSASDDPSDTGSLRYALDNATPGEVIDFAPNVRTIDLTGGLTIGVNLSIVNDQGTGPVTIDGGGNPYRLLTVSGTATYTPTVSLSGLTITDGGNNGSAGGGILNDGTLFISNCTISDNFAATGGGILNDGTLAASNCTFTNNLASGGLGGAINSNGTLAVSNCTFSDNSTGGYGGGICDNGTGGLVVVSSTFTHDTAGYGGGICNNSIAAAAVSDCTFSNNAGDTEGVGGGGGIFNVGTLNVNNSTFFNNTAENGGGGAIENGNTGNPSLGTLTVSDCTFSANSTNASSNNGGAIYAGSNSTLVTLNSNIVVGNFNTFSSMSPDDIDGLVGLSSSDNLIGTGDTGGLINVNGNQVGVSVASVGLQPLANNGGPTETMAIGPGSVALGAGITEAMATTDQRGVARPVNEPSDVGAFQYTVFNPTSVEPYLSPSQSATVGNSFAQLEALVTDSNGKPTEGVSVTFAVVAEPGGAEGTFTGNTTVTTNANGIAIAPALTAGDTAGAFTVTASVNGVASPADFNLTNTPGSPATITAVGGSSEGAPIGAPFDNALQAKVVDAFGNPLGGVPVTFSAPATGATGTFRALTTVPTNALGIAMAPTFTANHIVGSYSVTATSKDIAAPATFTLTNTTVPAAIATYSATAEHASVNSAFTTPLGVRVTNAAGSPVVGITVDFELSGGAANGTFAGSSAVATNANGVATAPTLTANTVAGSFTVSAWVGQVKTPATFSLTNLPLGPSAVNVIAGSGQAAALGIAYAKTLQAEVVDKYGNPLSGVTVTFHVPTTGASGTFAGHTTATAVTAANGIATIAITANSTPGNFQATASVAQVATPATFSLTNSPIHALKVVAGSPQNATTNTAYSAALQVKAVDAAGNPLQGVSITFTAPSSGASGTFATSATVLTGSNGIAIAPAFTANGVAGSFNVTASLTSAVAGVAPVTFALKNVAPSHGVRRALMPLAHSLGEL